MEICSLRPHHPMHLIHLVVVLLITTILILLEAATLRQPVTMQPMLLIHLEAVLL